jgi:hypothetical protein
MNLAIVIGAANYKNMNPLPSCKADALAMQSLLRVTSKYEEILFLLNATALDIKDKLADFTTKYRNETIHEVFFYYLGHGEIGSAEFLYLATDYNEDQRNLTSLKNSLLDNYLRQLGAKLTVKVVDACYAGQRYVKAPGSLKEYLEKTKFENCYFLFSSQGDQESYCGGAFSDFTEAILKALLVHPDVFIRYGTVIDRVADSFISRPDQQPFFVAQASFTERFCDLTPTVRKTIESLLRPTAERSPYISPLIVIAGTPPQYVSRQENLALNEPYQLLRKPIDELVTPPEPWGIVNHSIFRIGTKQVSDEWKQEITNALRQYFSRHFNEIADVEQVDEESGSVIKEYKSYYT